MVFLRDDFDSVDQMMVIFYQGGISTRFFILVCNPMPKNVCAQDYVL